MRWRTSLLALCNLVAPASAQGAALPSISRSDDGAWQASSGPACEASLGGLIEKSCDEAVYASDPTSACCGCDNFADKDAGLECGLATLVCMQCDDLAREHCPVTCPAVCNQGGVDGVRCKLVTKTLDIGCESLATASACMRIPYLYLVILAVVAVMMLFACFPKLCLPCQAACCLGKCVTKLCRCLRGCVCGGGESDEDREARERAARRARRAKRRKKKRGSGSGAEENSEQRRQRRSQETFMVAVPRGMRPGQEIEFTSPRGFEHRATIPDLTGDSFRVTMPKRHTAGRLLGGDQDG